MSNPEQHIELTVNQYAVPNPEAYDKIRNLSSIPLRVSFTGSDNFPENGRGIYAPNHTRKVDIPVTGIALDRINDLDNSQIKRATFIGKEELLRYLIIGSWIERMGTIPLDREKPDRSTFERASEVLSSPIDNMLVLYPQGTRIKGRPTSIEEGAALFSSNSEAPVFPMGIVYPFGMLLGKIHVHLGEKIEPATKGKIGRIKFASMLLKGMQAAYDVALREKRGY